RLGGELGASLAAVHVPVLAPLESDGAKEKANEAHLPANTTGSEIELRPENPQDLCGPPDGSSIAPRGCASRSEWRSYPTRRSRPGRSSSAPAARSAAPPRRRFSVPG